MKQEEPDKKPSVAIIGVVGVPGAYGGFETLADELIQYAEEQGVSSEFIVYCSGQNRMDRLTIAALSVAL